MTPEDHYDEAERLTSSLRNQVSTEHGWPAIDADRSQATDAAVNRAVALAGLHLKAAEVGLALRNAAPQFADETDDIMREHDFTDGRGRHNAAKNCQKCGRCWDHKGAECVGGQEHSTAKTCLVCIGGRS